MRKTRIAVLGGSGSIGVQTLEVAKKHCDRFEVALIANNQNEQLLQAQCAAFGSEGFCRSTATDSNRLSLPETYSNIDIVVNGISGLDGLAPSVAALTAGKVLATANKESIVCFGRELKALAKTHGGSIRPVDSEHSTIWQCLENPIDVKRLIITASGGAFRDLTLAELKSAKAKDALKHPNWLMGKKVTIDCATMVNKGLEIIEAKQLFGIQSVMPVLHRESIVHSLVEYLDGTIKAGLSLPSMITPIQYALCYPDRLSTSIETLDLLKVGSLHFEEIDRKKYPALSLAEEVSDKADEFYNTVFVAADAVLVDMYLKDMIGYFDIPTYISRALQHIKPQKIDSIDTVLDISCEVNSYILSIVGGHL